MITPVHPYKCLTCGHLLNATERYNGNDIPESGSISLCIHCGAAMVFNEDLTVRFPMPSEIAEIDNDPEVILFRCNLLIADKDGILGVYKKKRL